MDKSIDYRKYIEDSFNWAKYKGFCKTKAEFAKIIGVNQCSVSSTKNSKYSGRNTAMKIASWRESVEGKFAPRIGEQTTDIDWKAYHREAAKVILASLVVSENGIYPDPEEVAGLAIVYADELVKQLKNG